MTEPRVTINDFVDQGICARGVRDACNEAGVDFREFVRHGMTEKEAQKFLPNAYVEQAIAHMKKRTA